MLAVCAHLRAVRQEDLVLAGVLRLWHLFDRGGDGAEPADCDAVSLLRWLDGFGPDRQRCRGLGRHVG